MFSISLYSNSLLAFEDFVSLTHFQLPIDEGETVTVFYEVDVCTFEQTHPWCKSGSDISVSDPLTSLQLLS